VNKKFCGGPGGGFSKEPPGRRKFFSFYVHPVDRKWRLVDPHGGHQSFQSARAVREIVIFFDFFFDWPFSLKHKKRKPHMKIVYPLKNICQPHKKMLHPLNNLFDPQ
jgi:hypothetical protein